MEITWDFELWKVKYRWIFFFVSSQWEACLPRKRWVLLVNIAWIVAEWGPVIGDLAAISFGLAHQTLRDCSWQVPGWLGFNVVLNISFHIVSNKCVVVCSMVQIAGALSPRLASRGKHLNLGIWSGRELCLIFQGSSRVFSGTCLCECHSLLHLVRVDLSGSPDTVQYSESTM